MISVFDKTGIDRLASGLVQLGIEIYSTGGTELLLREENIPVLPVSDLTGFPEILGGRVKTLHPHIHGAILARRDLAEHVAELERMGVVPLDMVVVNLYPFRDTVNQPGVTMDAALESVDIGGTALLRAAAKNFKQVIPLCDPADYQEVLEEIQRSGDLSEDHRRRLAAKAFQYCATYDTHIATYLRPPEDMFPERLTLPLRKISPLRYGENPHQLAAFYEEDDLRPPPAGVVGAQQLHGKQLSYNNTYDLDAAWGIVMDFSAPTVALVKHGNPCGLSCGDNLAETFRRALACDPQSAFGGAVGVNRVVDKETAEEIHQVFFEDIIAPDYTEEARDILMKKRDLRIVATGVMPEDAEWQRASAAGYDFKKVLGGYLMQTRDAVPENVVAREVVTVRHPSLEELTGLLFAWRAVKHVRSNAIVLAKKLSLVGVGAGQMSRVDSVDLACRKAGDRALGAVMASDAFFPFPDGVERAAEAGVTAVIQPGGSIRDQEVIRAANRHHMAMLFTHQRHFRH